jgi:hypothetical protein
VLRWRLRVDDKGLWRRRLVGWDLWPWEAFEQGRVQEAEDTSTSYVWSEKPFWARRLSLDLIEVDDREKLAGIIRRVFVRPAAPPLPVELQIRYAFRKEAFIARECLLIRNRGEDTRYAWREVELLRIRRRYRDRQDFNSLELVVPGQSITLRVSHHHGQAARSWTGATGSTKPTPAVVAAVLERYVPGDRVRVISLGDPPQTIDEWQDRHSMLAKQGRDLRTLRWIMCGVSGVLASVTLSEFYRDGWSGLKFLILCSVQLGLIWAVMRYIERDHFESVTKLEAQVPDR